MRNRIVPGSGGLTAINEFRMNALLGYFLKSAQRETNCLVWLQGDDEACEYVQPHNSLNC
jgi:hypothetical protein